MQYLASFTAMLVCVATLGCGGRVALIGVERFMSGALPAREDRLEALQSLGIIAVLHGLVFNPHLTLVGLLMIALGILLQGDDQRQRGMLEVPLLLMSIVAVIGIGACKALRPFLL